MFFQGNEFKDVVYKNGHHFPLGLLCKFMQTGIIDDMYLFIVSIYMCMSSSMLGIMILKSCIMKIAKRTDSQTRQWSI